MACKLEIFKLLLFITLLLFIKVMLDKVSKSFNSDECISPYLCDTFQRLLIICLVSTGHALASSKRI